MDLRKLKTLIELIQNSDIAELELSDNDESVRIVRGKQEGITTDPADSSEQKSTSEASSVKSTITASPLKTEGHMVTSPMVGIFYRATSSTSKPFVEVGHSVQVGQPLCVIEAMKLMNQIDAEHNGTVKQILVENGQPVEFGQPLFVIG